MTSTRQLAAIVFTDIVGYTALMGKDSKKALELVQRSKEIQKPLVEKHNGKWLKEMGDGVMVQFSTALDAVNCAIEIQEVARGKLDAKLRIGIHLGDVTVEENDVHGDGVNVASRIEAITDPGGIYISESIEKAIRGQTDIQAKFLGEIKLKNVDYDVRTYALQGVGLPIPEIRKEKKLSGHLWAEIQRRAVPRAALAYILAGWFILQLGKVALPELGLQGLNSYLPIILIIGLPIAIYLAWSYELSPDGFVTTSSAQSWQNPYSDSRKKPLTNYFIMIAMGGIILVMYLFPASANRSIMGNPMDSKSIAVLPFDNLSNDPEQLYFSDGIQEDILNHLSKISDLSVKSRSSTLRYRENRPSIAQIGDDLGVGTILEGSVRKYGNKIRISAQLIDVATDEHIWSEAYDRELNEVLAIQSEVALEIARQLEVRLSEHEVETISKVATENIDAYDHLLKARRITQQWNTESDLDEALGFLSEAISIDPGLAEGYFETARILYRYKKEFGLPKEVWLDSAMMLLDRAISIDPSFGKAHALRGRLLRFAYVNIEESYKELKLAYELAPNDPDVLIEYGNLLLMDGEYDDGARLRMDAIEKKWGKQDANYYFELGLVYSNSGDYEKSNLMYNQAVQINPDWADPYRGLGFNHTLMKDHQEALTFWQKVLELADPVKGFDYTLAAESFLTLDSLELAEKYFLKAYELEQEFQDSLGFLPLRKSLATIYWKRGERKKARSLLNEHLELNKTKRFGEGEDFWGYRTTYFDDAMIYGFLGRKEEALELLENPENLKWAPPEYLLYYLDYYAFDSLRNEPRFKEVVANKQKEYDLIAEAYRKAISEKEASTELKLDLRK